MMSSQIERYIMSTQANFLAIFNIDFSIINDYQHPTVDQLLCFHVIPFYPFQCQHQRAPYTQNPDVIQNLNRLEIELFYAVAPSDLTLIERWPCFVMINRLTACSIIDIYNQPLHRKGRRFTQSHWA